MLSLQLYCSWIGIQPITSAIVDLTIVGLTIKTFFGALKLFLKLLYWT